jgi:hypothetical protein
MLNTRICFKATDNLTPKLSIISFGDPRNPKFIMIPLDMRSQKVTQESDHQCITVFMGTYGGVVSNIGHGLEGNSKSIHVYARQYYEN